MQRQFLTSDFLFVQQVNSTEERVEVTGLSVGQFYRFFVIARNEWGTSLPSALVIVNASLDAWEGKEVVGGSSPPHLMEVKAHSATWLQFSWNPPAISHPEDILSYRYVGAQCCEAPIHPTAPLSLSLSPPPHPYA